MISPLFFIVFTPGCRPLNGIQWQQRCRCTYLSINDYVITYHRILSRDGLPLPSVALDIANQAVPYPPGI